MINVVNGWRKQDVFHERALDVRWYTVNCNDAQSAELAKTISFIYSTSVSGLNALSKETQNIEN